MVGGGRSLALESLVVSSAASCLILFFSYFVVFLQLYTRNKNKIEQRNLGRRGGGEQEKTGERGRNTFLPHTNEKRKRKMSADDAAGDPDSSPRFLLPGTPILSN